MKYPILCFLFIMLMVRNANASDPDKEIRDVLYAQVAAWNAGNLEGYMQGYWKSDSLIFVGKKGPQYGWSKTLENYKKSYPGKDAMGTLRFGILRIDMINDDHALVTGSWALRRKDDAPAGYYTLLFKRIKGNWVIVNDHSS